MTVSICQVCGSVIHQGGANLCSSTCRSRSSRANAIHLSPISTFYMGLGSNYGIRQLWMVAIIAINLARIFSDFEPEKCRCNWCGVFSITCTNSAHSGMCDACYNLDLPF